MNWNFQNKGFTLIELMVATGITVLLSTIFVIDWREGQGALALNQAASKVSQDVKRAAEFSLRGRAYSCGSGSITGYGMYVTTADPASYLIFADCNGNQRYDAGTDGVSETILLDSFITISGAAPLAASVFFLPPDPVVSLQDASGDSLSTTQITLATKKNVSRTKVITINAKGVVSIQ